LGVEATSLQSGSPQREVNSFARPGADGAETRWNAKQGAIADLGDKLRRLPRTIDERWPELDSGNVKPWGRLVTVYSQNGVRLGQLMRARRALRED